MSKRKMKTTQQQYQLYVEELESNVHFRNNKNEPDHPNILETTWNALTERLNSLGGPVNNCSAWKNVFANWKYTTRKKARLLKLADLQSGKNNPPERPLTALESKLVDITGRAVVDGLTVDLPEYGISANQSSDSVVEVEAETAAKTITLAETPAKKIKRTETPTRKFKSPEKFAANLKITTSVSKLTLTSAVKNLIEKSEANTDTYLKDINSNLVQLINVQQRILDVEVLKLKLKYPDTVFTFEGEQA